MAHSNTIEIDLSDEILAQLQAKAQREQASLNDLVREALELYLEEDEVYEDTPDEKIAADFRQAWLEVMFGQSIPAREALNKLLAESDDDDHQG